MALQLRPVNAANPLASQEVKQSIKATRASCWAFMGIVILHAVFKILILI